MDRHSRVPRVAAKRTKRTEKRTVFKKKTLQVQTKTLRHSGKSLLAVKEQRFNYEEDSPALKEKDLLKIIDKNTEHKPYNTNTTVSCQTKSLFLEIDKQFDDLTTKSIAKPLNTNNYLISDADLKKLVLKKYLENKNLILNSWERNLQNFLTYARAGNFSNIVINRIRNNQSKINANSVLYELDFKFRDIKLAETFVKRKFVRRYNELSKLQDLNVNLINIFEATDLIREVRLGVLPKMSVDVSVKAIDAAEKPVDLEKFPQESFRTPEKQKYKITDFSVLTHSLTPVVKTKISINYLENIKDSPVKNRYTFQTKTDKQYDSLNLNTIFDRPKKPETLRKDRKRFSFEYTSPKSTKPVECDIILTPNRKLNFNETKMPAIPEIKSCFDFVPLETARKRVTRCLAQNIPRFGEEMSLKRPLEGIQTPEEIKIRRIESVLHNSDDAELGLMPRMKNTPEFKYGRNFFH